jgi:hypothetical protein
MPWFILKALQSLNAQAAAHSFAMGDGYVASSTSPLPGENTRLAMVALQAMGFLCSLEVVVLALATFRKWRGLYFWALITASINALLFNLGSVLYFFVYGYNLPWLSAILFDVSFPAYILAEFLVLYSRLYLLNPSHRTVRFVQWLITTEVVLIELPSAVMGAISFYSVKAAGTYSFLARIEGCVYASTGIILSGVYFFHVMRLWGGDKLGTVQRHLLISLLAVTLLDLGNIALLFSAIYELQCAYVVRFWDNVSNRAILTLLCSVFCLVSSLW